MNLYNQNTSSKCLVAICALSPSSENCYLACQSMKTSDYYTTSVSPSTNGVGDIEIYDTNDMKLSNIVQAHKSPISCIVMNSDGTLLATASEKVKGSLMRLFHFLIFYYTH